MNVDTDVGCRYSKLFATLIKSTDYHMLVSWCEDSCDSKDLTVHGIDVCRDTVRASVSPYTVRKGVGTL